METNPIFNKCRASDKALGPGKKIQKPVLNQSQFRIVVKLTTLGPAVFRVQFSLVLIFKKIAQISSLCDSHNISEGIPSLLHIWLIIT